MEDALDGGAGGTVVGHDEGSDLVAFHKGQGVAGEGGGGDGVGGGVEDVGGGLVEGAGAGAGEEAAEVAVGEDAEEFALGLDGGKAEALGGHLVDDLWEGCGWGDRGDCVAGVHELVDGDEAPAQLASGVKLCEVLGLEVEAATDVDGEGIS